jgi:hypothetical protein
MGWKYIMIEATHGDMRVLFPVIFPDKMIHIEVATVMKLCGPLAKFSAVKVVSAGAIEHLEIDGLHGESTTLGIRSKPEDKRIIENYSYLHGVL